MSVSDPNPLNRPAVYSFSTSSTTTDALEFYLGSRIPIKNSAGSVVTGYKMRTVEPSLRVTVNLQQSPIVIAREIANTVNNPAWAGGDIGTWLCTGISGSQETEVVGAEVITYWKVSGSFSYREQKWRLEYADVGLYELVDGRRRRCRVEDSDGNYQSATTPQPLNSDGTQRNSTTISTRTAVIYDTSNFATYFPSP